MTGDQNSHSVVDQFSRVPSNLTWSEVAYPDDINAPIYHGESLQCLRRYAINGQELIGEIAANSPSHLGSEARPTVNWTIAPSVIDACLYASAILAGHHSKRLSLPSRFDKIVFGRLPDPGEVCRVHCRLMEETPNGLSLEFALRGQNGDLLLSAEGYHLAWLGLSEASAVPSSTTT